MPYSRKEKEYWNGLIDLRLQYITDIISKSVSTYRRKLGRLDSIEDRIEFLKQLDRRSSRLEGILSLEREQRKVNIERSPYSLPQYFKQMQADKVTQARIKHAINNPDKKQIGKILLGKNLIKVANKIGVNYYTLISIKNDMLDGHGRPSANSAKFVQYLISEGYQVRGYKS